MTGIFLIALVTQIQVFFETDDLPHQLSVAISRAEHSLDIAFHQLYESDVVDSILSAHERGVRVRVITEHDYYGYTYRLRNAGITVVDEFNDPHAREHRMHHKFVVIDYRDSDTTNDMVWNGSYNASSALHADNALLVHSHALASIFEAEFNQMWGDTGDVPSPENARTGSDKVDVAPFHSVDVNGTEIEVYFAPQDAPAQRLEELVLSADSSIDFCIFYFTRSDLANAMAERAEAGVTVRGVYDSSGMDYSSATFNLLRSRGAQVAIDHTPPPFYYLHHKFMVVDDSIVETGSMNWTISGNRYNDENIMVIHSPEIASSFESEFMARFSEAGYIAEDGFEGNRKGASPSAIVFSGIVKFRWPHVEIYSVAGEKVASVEDGRLDGSTLPNGIYFAVWQGGRMKLIKLAK